jgi:hypothetical protein
MQCDKVPAHWTEEQSLARDRKSMRRFNLLSMSLSKSPLGPILGRYAWSVPVVAALGFLSSALEGLGIGMLIPLLNGLLQGGGASADTGILSVVTRFGRDAVRTAV